VKLSKRRLEFLEALADLVNQKGSPVHYIDVSEKMNVSKWTAYDMMRELADDGLVEASYSLSPTGSPGRSQVLFSPTERGYSLVGLGREQSRDPQLPDQWDDEWQYRIRKPPTCLTSLRASTAHPLWRTARLFSVS